MFLATPLALVSYWAFLWALPLIPILVWRIIGEERVLMAELPGYPEYVQKVTHRLIPGVW
jgi:protein-S-isoprenylcysteine O-methyltransferase Ste14